MSYSYNLIIANEEQIRGLVDSLFRIAQKNNLNVERPMFEMRIREQGVNNGTYKWKSRGATKLTIAFERQSSGDYCTKISSSINLACLIEAYSGVEVTTR